MARAGLGTGRAKMSENSAPWLLSQGNAQTEDKKQSNFMERFEQVHEKFIWDLQSTSNNSEEISPKFLKN